MVTIRLLKKQDKNSFITLVNRYIDEYPRIDTVYPSRRDPLYGHVLWEKLQKPKSNHITLLASSGEELIGFCIGEIHKYSELEAVYYQGEKRGDAWDLYLESSWRGKGVGSLLLKELEHQFKQHGCNHMVLNAVAFSNIKARELYEKLGYTPWVMEFYKSL